MTPVALEVVMHGHCHFPDVHVHKEDAQEDATDEQAWPRLAS